MSVVTVNKKVKDWNYRINLLKSLHKLGWAIIFFIIWWGGVFLNILMSQPHFLADWHENWHKDRACLDTNLRPRIFGCNFYMLPKWEMGQKWTVGQKWTKYLMSDIDYTNWSRGVVRHHRYIYWNFDTQKDFVHWTTKNQENSVG